MDEILTSLSEMIRSLSRISNKNPESVSEIDLKRLENAKQVLSKNTSINENEIPKTQNANT
jgi:regulatory protein YycH of two-component signal transduction system YycFG